MPPRILLMPWPMVKEGVLKLREERILESIIYVRSEDPPEDCIASDSSEDTAFTRAIRNRL